MSFKIWNAATVGGNICMSLPAGADDLAHRGARRRLHALAARRQPREVPVVDFVTGNHTNVLQPGELLRSIHLPARALAQALRLPPHLADPSRALGRAAHRHAQRRRRRFPADHHRGHAAAGAARASTACRRPASCARRSTSAVRPNGYFDDVHGSAAYKRHLTYYFAEQIRAELVGGA